MMVRPIRQRGRVRAQEARRRGVRQASGEAGASAPLPLRRPPQTLARLRIAGRPDHAPPGYAPRARPRLRLVVANRTIRAPRAVAPPPLWLVPPRTVQPAGASRRRAIRQAQPILRNGPRIAALGMAAAGLAALGAAIGQMLAALL